MSGYVYDACPKCGARKDVRARTCFDCRDLRDCLRHRAEDAEVCREDLRELWGNRLDRQADGSYLRRRVFVARDFTRAAA